MQSVARFRAALAVAQQCPAHLGNELALTGSAARGWADDDSDIEFVSWCPQVPSPGARRAWLESIGASELAPDPHASTDGTIWDWSRFHGFWLETGWQSIRRHEELLRAIRNGSVTDHRLVIVADAIVHAVPLRTEGLLEGWQRQLQVYPDATQHALIRAGARRWQYALSYWALARRGDRIATTERLLADVQSVLRMVFARNRIWEPAWKWSARRYGELTVQPARMAERIDEILSFVNLERSCQVCAELFDDTLALVPADVDVTSARNTILASLRDRAP